MGQVSVSLVSLKLKGREGGTLGKSKLIKLKVTGTIRVFETDNSDESDNDELTYSRKLLLPDVVVKIGEPVGKIVEGKKEPFVPYECDKCEETHFLKLSEMTLRDHGRVMKEFPADAFARVTGRETIH